MNEPEPGDASELTETVRLLQERLERAEATIAGLTSAADRSGPTPAGAGTPLQPSEIASIPTDRRHLLKRAGLAAGAAAAAGIAASVAGATPVAAADGDHLVLGSTNNSADHRTQAWNLSTADENLFEFADTITAADTDDETALVGFATRVRTGIAGVSTAADGIGVAAKATGTNGVGAWATGPTAGLLAAASSLLPGTAAILAANSLSGLWVNNCLFPIVLTNGGSPPPTSPFPTGIEAPMGATYVDHTGVLYFCVAGGNPGTWLRITGPGTAGAFTAITPTRVYDSRLGAGRLPAWDNRVLSIANGIDLTTGAVNAPELVPQGTTAIAYNVTATDTQGAGYLQIAPGDATGLTSSSINWTATGQTIANGLVVKVDTSRQIKASTGPGATNFIIDVLGYYR